MIDLNNALTYKSKTKNVKARTIKGYQVNGKDSSHIVFESKNIKSTFSIIITE